MISFLFVLRLKGHKLYNYRYFFSFSFEKAVLNSTIDEAEYFTDLLTTQFLLQELCQKSVLLADTHSLGGLFNLPQLKRIAVSLNDVPKLISVILESFLSEDLHRFFVDYQLSYLLESFPKPFCGSQEISKYFNLTSVQNLMTTLCSLDMDAYVQEFESEFLANHDNFVKQNMNMNATVIKNDILNKTECLLNTTMRFWLQDLIDISPLMKVPSLIHSLDSDQW